MFGFLKKLLTRRGDGNPLKQTHDLYSPAECLLYGYWNGHKYVFQDPLVLYKRVMEIGPELSINIQVANTPIKGNIEASNSLMAQIRKVFDIEPYDKEKPDASGLTEIGLTNLLGHFLTYCDEIKKNILPSAIPPTISEATASPISSAPEESQATPPSSGTTSIANAPSTETPTPPPSASVPPSDSSSPPLIILGPTQMERETPSS